MGWFPQQTGGLNRMYYHLMHHLPQAGVDVRGLVTGEPVPTNGVSIDAFAPTEAGLFTRLRRARSAARHALSGTGPDVVVSHFALYTVPWLDRIGDRPFVVHFHGPWAAESEVEFASSLSARLKKHLERLVYHRADRLIVLSDAFRQLLIDRYGLPAARIRVVPGGVDASAYGIDLSRTEARRRMGWPTDRPIALSVRRLVRRVGLERLIDATKQVRRQVPDVLVLIAGQGPLEAELHQRIREAGLVDHVRLLGYVPDADLPQAYRAADVSVVPTIALEGFGLVVVESLAAGTPALVTPVGGLPEIVAPLAPDLVLANDDPATIAAALVQAFRRPSSLPTAAECRSYARAHYDWPTVARRTRAVYQEVL